ncbi:PREDICTED: uncharacterized threonine-rich GPI-anchored glycoprotein PJ4664.02-like, partial [Nicotiana attenuata]|uniref:uncharacterized threonine-rich GPI-anchored glycoprotein PJ4664.02-like n=1 Tax=Nicotiana attenuata TaxID=49451 RepID=UPI000905D07F
MDEQPLPSSATTSTSPPPYTNTSKEEWKTVQFSKKKTNHYNTATPKNYTGMLFPNPPITSFTHLNLHNENPTPNLLNSNKPTINPSLANNHFASLSKQDLDKSDPPLPQAKNPNFTPSNTTQVPTSSVKSAFGLSSRPIISHATGHVHLATMHTQSPPHPISPHMQTLDSNLPNHSTSALPSSPCPKPNVIIPMHIGNDNLPNSAEATKTLLAHQSLTPPLSSIGAPHPNEISCLETINQMPSNPIVHSSTKSKLLQNVLSKSQLSTKTPSQQQPVQPPPATQQHTPLTSTPTFDNGTKHHCLHCTNSTCTHTAHILARDWPSESCSHIHDGSQSRGSNNSCKSPKGPCSDSHGRYAAGNGDLWQVPLVDNPGTSLGAIPTASPSHSTLGPLLSPPPYSPNALLPTTTPHHSMDTTILGSSSTSNPSIITQQLPPRSPNQAEHDQNLQEELDAAIVYSRETRPIHALLNGIKVFVQKEEYERKIYIRCPPNLLSTSFRLRPTTNPAVGKYAMLLMPTFILRPGETSDQTSHRDSQGVHSDEFRRNFRSLLDYNTPSLAVLLETHSHSNQAIKDDFNFTGLIEVPAIGQSGEIAILWLADVLHVEHADSLAKKSTVKF